MGQPTVALLGTGVMGAGMAKNLTAAGLPLRVWNRTKAKAEPLADAGATVADTAAEAASGADIVLTMAFDADSVASQIEAAQPAPGTIWIQSATVGVEGSKRLGQLADKLGLRYVDAPVLGTKKPAEDGALVVLASGPDDVREIIRPVFDAVGSRTLWLGEAGNGSKLKLVANLWVGTMITGIAESLALAETLGLDPNLFIEAVKGGAMDAPYVQMKGKTILAGDYTPTFALSGAAKDTQLILAAADGGLELVLARAVADQFAAGVDAGNGDLDLSAAYLNYKPE
jgi:3-hydroxyisobutyrate dehydrogenase